MTYLRLLLFSLILSQISCSESKSTPFAGLFNGELPSNGIPGDGSAPDAEDSIQLLAIQEVAVPSSVTYPSNIAFDGTRLLWMNRTGIDNCFPNDRAEFQYLSLDFAPQSTSASTFAGISSSGLCGGVPIFGTSAGFSGLYWEVKTGGNTVGRISVRDNASGAIMSTINFDWNNYGCSNNGLDRAITFCNGLYYGTCTVTGGQGQLRFFSANSNGALQSAVTTNISANEYGKINAMTCYRDQYLIFVSARNLKDSFNAFHKFDLSFSRIATDPTTSAGFPEKLKDISGIATDGENLYLQGRFENAASPYAVKFARASLGALK